MATVRWRGDAVAVSQVNTITPANVTSTNTFTVTINGKSITFTAAASTVANVTAGLVALLNASTIPEFAEITWADVTTAITGTADTAGKAFTQTSSASGGTATLVTAVSTANAGPNDWSTAANWSGGAVPVAGDDVFIDQGTVDILYGFAQSAVTLTSLNIGPGFTGKLGLPVVNSGGYYEYRATFLAIGATTQNITSASGRLKIDNGSVATTLNVYGTGQPAETNIPALLWKGTHASNVLNITRGSMGCAFFPGETATLATIRCGFQKNQAGDVTLVCGTGVTLTTINQTGGLTTYQSNMTTLTMTAGDCSILAGTLTTLKLEGGTLHYRSTGTLTTCIVSGGATLDLSQDMRSRTITTLSLYAGSILSDPFGTLGAQAFTTVYCDLDSLTLDFGLNRTYTLT